MEAVFSNGREIHVLRDCLLVVTHPSVGGGTTGRVRTGGARGGRVVVAGVPVTGLLAARAAAAAARLLARHR